MSTRPRILYVVTEDWYFASHRLPMARAAREAGFEVHVATRVEHAGGVIEAEGFRLHGLDMERGRLAPSAIARSVARVRGLYLRLRPDVAHHVGVQASVIGSLAALRLPMATLNAVAGLGFAFTSTTPRARAVRAVLSAAIPRLFAGPRSAVLVQNPDDRAAMTSLGVPGGKIALIAGSGVDVDRLRPLPEPTHPITVAFVGRLLADKGLFALLDAHEILRQQGRPVRLLLAGSPDPANPASVPAEVLAGWRGRAGVSLLGHVADVRDVWGAAHMAVLPSRREGLPLSLLEAAACGRAIVATDVPGCREIARAGVNAELVPVDDAVALAGALDRLAGDAALRARYARAGRALVESEFSSAHVGSAVVALYRRLLEKPVEGASTRPLQP